MIRVGPHLLTCLDIASPAVSDLFEDGKKAHILYCDPPWGDGAVKMFATMASKATGRKIDPISYELLADRLFELIAKHVSCHVYIETGLRWQADMIRRMQKIGLRNIETITLRYGGSKQFENVLIFGTFLNATGGLGRLQGMSGARVSQVALENSQPGQILFDPCCGCGYSARAAVKLGLEFRGNELNPARLERTQRVLEAAR